MTRIVTCTGHCRGDAHDNRGRGNAPGLLSPRWSLRQGSGRGVAANLANGNVGSGLLGRISEAWPALAPPDGYFPYVKFLAQISLAPREQTTRGRSRIFASVLAYRGS